ncbi:hypothetical protein [Luteimonas fraxinea]|uniref:Uncharacterized protein n=1 Tax=Luteimonas fraxinea TaxID=2901869 RepID=A0ABS8UBE3_9GAMM|nr:hypothetical protein [Luteimonas fraxinea]MCD9096197.1 hypothetical protein [Luteimonas fraxinea]
MAFTNSGSTVSICITPQNSNVAQAAFVALAYVPIANVGNLGERGANTNIVNYDTWDTNTTLKGKGITNAGDPQLEVAQNLADPGQIALRAAAASRADNYAFKVLRQNGDAQYFRGLVTGPTEPGGRNEDFVLNVFTLALNQIPIDVAATP